YKLDQTLGIINIAKYGSKFGFGPKTGIDLTGEHDDTMPSRTSKHTQRAARWFPGAALITVIGPDHMTATPPLLSQTTSLIAERGKGFVPHLLKSIRDPETGDIKPFQPRPAQPIVLDDPKHWDVVIDGMRSVINASRGTAHRYAGQDLQYTLAGKSGTAQVTEIKQGVIAPDVDDMPYNKRPHALFIAFAPIEDPQIAVAVIVEHGGGGSSVASPIARQVIDAYLLHDDNTLQAMADQTS